MMWGDIKILFLFVMLGLGGSRRKLCSGECSLSLKRPRPTQKNAKGTSPLTSRIPPPRKTSIPGQTWGPEDKERGNPQKGMRRNYQNGKFPLDRRNFALLSRITTPLKTSPPWKTWGSERGKGIPFAKSPNGEI